MNPLTITDLYVGHQITINPYDVVMVQPWSGNMWFDVNNEPIHPQSRIAWKVGTEAFYAMTAEPYDVLVARWKAVLHERSR